MGSAERAQEAQADAAPGKAAKPAATGMADIAAGGVVAAAVSFAASGLRVLGESVSGWFALGGAVFRLPMGFSLALLGAGYLIGIVAGLAMLTGLVIAWGIAVPVLTSMGDLPTGKTLAQYATGIWSSQVRFIGAGVIGVGAIWTLATLFMPMARGVKASFSALSKAGKARAGQAPRTERDLSAGWISLVTLVLVAILVVTFQVFLADAPLSAMAVWKLVAYAVLFAFVFGFLVAAACGYMAGLVGTSSSPISGVGIVAIVLVSLLMLVLGGELLEAKNGVQMTIALAIFSTSAVVAVASIANDNLQDLKTGWLVGATPWRQQVALLIGCVLGAAVISPVLELLYNAYGFADAMPREGMDPPGPVRAAGDADAGDRARHLLAPAELDHDPDRHGGGRGPDRGRRHHAAHLPRGAHAGAGRGHRHLPAAHRRRAAGGGRLAGLGAGARAAPPRRGRRPAL